MLSCKRLWNSGVYFTRFFYPRYFSLTRAKTSDSSGTFFRRFQNSEWRKHSHQELVTTFSNNRSSTHSILTDAHVQYNNSIAEESIVNTTTKDQPLIKKKLVEIILNNKQTVMLVNS